MCSFYMATLLLVVVKVSAKRFDTTELESNANLQPRNDDGKFNRIDYHYHCNQYKGIGIKYFVS